MDLNKSNYDKKILYVIDRDGNIISVPKVKGEKVHYEPYSRLNKMLGGMLGNITKYDTGLNLPNIVSKHGFINISPLLIDDLSYGWDIVFPLEKTYKQLEALKSLYSILEAYKVGFIKQPNFYGKCLDFDEELIEGLEKLKKYVEEELEKIEKNYDEITEGNRE